MTAWILGIISSIVFLLCLANYAAGGRLKFMPKLSPGVYCIIMLICFALATACIPSMFGK